MCLSVKRILLLAARVFILSLIVKSAVENIAINDKSKTLLNQNINQVFSLVDSFVPKVYLDHARDFVNSFDAHLNVALNVVVLY